MKFLEKLWRISEKNEKNEDIKIITTKARRNYLVSEPNYHTLKTFCTKNPANIYEKSSLFRFFNISKQVIKLISKVKIKNKSKK